MAKRYLQNDTAQTKFVGGVMIPPGEGRDIDECFLPPGLPDEAASLEPPAGGEQKPDLLQNLKDTLALPIKDIKPLLEGFSDETLAQLEALEGEQQAPRKGLLEAIGEEKLARAQRRTGAPT